MYVGDSYIPVYVQHNSRWKLALPIIVSVVSGAPYTHVYIQPNSCWKQALPIIIKLVSSGCIYTTRTYRCMYSIIAITCAASNN